MCFGAMEARVPSQTSALSPTDHRQPSRGPVEASRLLSVSEASVCSVDMDEMSLMDDDCEGVDCEGAVLLLTAASVLREPHGIKPRRSVHPAQRHPTQHHPTQQAWGSRPLPDSVLCSFLILMIKKPRAKKPVNYTFELLGFFLGSFFGSVSKQSWLSLQYSLFLSCGNVYVVTYDYVDYLKDIPANFKHTLQRNGWIYPTITTGSLNLSGI